MAIMKYLWIYLQFNVLSAVDFSSETSWHSAVLDHPLFMFFEKTLQVAVIYVYR
jgi:hypothetical protein